MSKIITLDNFDKFISGSWDYDPEKKIHSGLFLCAPNADIGGGRIPIEEIDVLKNYPQADTLTIMGLTQKTFEYFIHTYGKQLRAIRFFKNKMVEDWSLLGELPHLEFVHFFANQRITKLWDMRRNDALTGLSISDFSRLKSIAGIERAPGLQSFAIGNAIWLTMMVETLQPLAGTKIKHLDFSGKKIGNDDLSFLLEMKDLERFDFPLKLFTTEQVAWIVANKPGVTGRGLRPTFEFMGYNEETKEMDIPTVCVIGKRKPMLQISTQSERIKKYTDAFYRLVEKYKGVPYQVAFPSA
ncbi:MAG: hypothetical protein FWD25_09515 [Clostridia bacterium]|nr:hypothetical protein [Clostridia bacterium]